MPLSEDEQRILHDIERSFYETDPKFAKTVTNTSLYRHAGRNCKWAVAGFLFSLIIFLVSFIRFPIIGFAGFLGMVTAAAVFVRNIRRIGSAGLHEVAESEQARRYGMRFSELRQRLRERFESDSD